MAKGKPGSTRTTQMGGMKGNPTIKQGGGQ